MTIQFIFLEHDVSAPEILNTTFSCEQLALQKLLSLQNNTITTRIVDQSPEIRKGLMDILTSPVRNSLKDLTK